MTVHAPSDVRSVTVPEHFGGCGVEHSAGDLEPGQRMSLDCGPCELALTSPPLNAHGWSSREDGVALTPDERLLLESQEKEGSAATALMVKQLGESLAQAVRHGHIGAAQLAPAQPQFVPPTADDIHAALKEMDPADLEQLLRRAGLAAPVEPDTAPEQTPTPDPAPAAKTPAKKTAAKAVPAADGAS